MIGNRMARRAVKPHVGVNIGKGFVRRSAFVSVVRLAMMMSVRFVLTSSAAVTDGSVSDGGGGMS